MRTVGQYGAGGLRSTGRLEMPNRGGRLRREESPGGPTCAEGRKRNREEQARREEAESGSSRKDVPVHAIKGARATPSWTGCGEIEMANERKGGRRSPMRGGDGRRVGRGGDERRGGWGTARRVVAGQ